MTQGWQAFIHDWLRANGITFHSFNEYKAPDADQNPNLWFNLAEYKDEHASKPFWHVGAGVVEQALRGQLRVGLYEGLETMLRPFTVVADEQKTADGEPELEKRRIFVGLDAVRVKRLQLKNGKSLSLIRVRPEGGRPGIDQLS